MRVCVLTTSYPRSQDDVAGVFVGQAVERLRASGIEVGVVSPADFRHFGIAFGDGIAQNLRARPWLVVLLPLFVAAFARAARRAARNADLVHAHWIPSSIAALATGRPFVLQVWGTDLELAARIPWLTRPLVRRARLVVAASSYLGEGVSQLGARQVLVIPNGLDFPDEVPRPEEPPHVLFAGRLSAEKGILEFLEATEGIPRVVVGDGPLRHLVSDAVGFVPHAQIGPYFGRAAVVCVPSRREGYGVVAREAMAHSRPVVATAVGGLRDAVLDGQTGFLVAPRDPAALRSALERLLGDGALRLELGGAGREHALARFSWDEYVAAMRRAYAKAVA